MLIGYFGLVLYYLGLALTLYKLVMLVDAAIRPAGAFRAADKKQKGFWIILLGLAVVLDLVPGLGGLISIFGVAGLIVAIIYQVDVRPAVKQIGKGGGRGTSRNTMGPYGPW
ncbi:hypothetical protein BIV57_09460 [Mangrovactinospora gilvigrisea]|uniref:DUF2516 domain-containing protein n=1 Tax=Mangrovactinospora gilvigrisea TaxID=1428644 RepID=A0A1J7BGQ1_9ACTN|nr:hypothetical protein BIV57_09460 [Mangrovactinospora gilvigrisea]